ncbi:hypothetical protein [Actinomyces qiguomingii]|uniref:hypothetical protein n=1 Tax=Actinomyces qiguomingii TaxID=2057800 RepID=UPI000CA0680D|nr:hypothetical protein [Actinomyces qiguomingii]
MNTSPSPKASLVRRRAAALLALGLALPGIVACEDEAPVTAAPETQQTDSADDPDAEPSPQDRSADDSTGDVDDDAYWRFPIQFDGWRVETLDVEGRNELNTTDGKCLYESIQNVYPQTEYSDEQETQFQADAWVEDFEDDYRNISSTQKTDTTVTDLSGNPVEMIKVETNYSSDRNDYKAITWIRVFTTKQMPVMMALNYTCTIDAIDETELEEMVSQTHIVNPGPAKMEDGTPETSSSSSDSSTSKDDDMV